MLGSAVVEALRGRFDVQPSHRADCDLGSAASTLRWIESRAPEVVVHCAAWTDVDGCERDPERAMRDNAEVTRHVAHAAHQVGAALCYISTDYVFDGEKDTPYLEDDRTAPINAYGRSKRAGEEHVLQRCPRSWVVRTSWLFGPRGRNFVRTMAGLLVERDEVRVVRDQVGAPTYTVDLARALQDLIVTSDYGVFHVTNAGSCSWYELTLAIEEQTQTGCRVLACTSAEMPRPAARPRNSVLANRRYDGAGLPPRRHWREALHEFMAHGWDDR